MQLANSISRTIGQTISSLKKLKALRLISSAFENEDFTPFANIKNLKHLELEHYGGSGDIIDSRNSLQSMLRNSMSTLQSLALATTGFASNLLPYFESYDPGKDATMCENHSFTALRSLSLSSMMIDASAINALHKAIDFMRLGQLTIVNLGDPDGLLMRHLITLAVSSQSVGECIRLRSLFLNMSDHSFTATPAQEEAGFKAKCHFISSFDTLTTLELPNYGQYPSNIATNPGLSDILLQAILKHKNLKTLRISYSGIISGFKVPYLSAATVGAIIGGLPQLQEFDFAPQEEQMVGLIHFA
jgi:hypothetical protein